MKNPKWKCAYPNSHKVKFGGKFLTQWDGYHLTLEQSTGGTITGNPMSGHNGQYIVLSAFPSAHYNFNGYSVTGGILSGDKIIINNSDMTAQASWIEDQKYTLTIQQTNGGKVTANKSTGYQGDQVTLSNTANSNYTFDSYNITGATLTGDKFNFVNQNVTAKGTFYINSNRTIINSGAGDHAFTAVGCTKDTMSAWKIDNARIFGFKYTFQLSNSDYYYAGTQMYMSLSGGYLNNSGRWKIEDDKILTVDIPGFKTASNGKCPPLDVGVLVYSQSAQQYATQWDEYWDRPGTAWHGVTPSFYLNTSNNKVSKVKSQIVNPNGASEITDPGDYYVYNSNWVTNHVTLNYIFEEKPGGVDNLYIYADNTFVGSSKSYFRKHNLNSNYWSYINHCGGGAARSHVNYYPWDSSGHIDYIVYSANTLQDAINA